MSSKGSPAKVTGSTYVLAQGGGEDSEADSPGEMLDRGGEGKSLDHREKGSDNGDNEGIECVAIGAAAKLVPLSIGVERVDANDAALTSERAPRQWVV